MRNAVINAIEQLSREYDNVFPIFGGALFATDAMHIRVDIDEFIFDYMSVAVERARLYNWHEDDNGVAKRFCDLCFVDYNLILAYLT